MKYILSTILVVLTSILLSACHHQQSAYTIKVGTISGPETILMETAQQVAEKRYHLHIIIVPFTDYSLPNRALVDRDIDANVFQHQPFLEADVQVHGYKLVAIGKTFLYPMAIYSDKIHQLKQVPNGAIVAVPDDPTNEGRALLLLQKAGLITLKHGSGTSATPLNISSNLKHLQFKELDAADLTRALPDVTLAVINTNFAVFAGLLPTKNSLFSESANSPYANLVVVRQGEEHKPQFNMLLAALHSSAVLKKAKQLFKNTAIPAWKVVKTS